MGFEKYASAIFLAGDFAESAEGALSDFEKIIPENSLVGGGDILSGIGPDRLISEIFAVARASGGEVISFFLLLLGLGLFFALINASSGILGKSLSSASRAGVSAISSLLIFSYLGALVFSVGESLGAISDFFSALIPIVTTVSLSSGALTAAGVQAANMNLTLALLGKLSEELLTPIVFMIFSLSLTSSLSAMPSRLLKGAKSVFLWLLGIVTTVLVASISMQSFLAVSKDSAALRAAKYALTGTIPIVGSTVSGALSTLIGSLAEARAVIGVGAVAVIFSLAASPIIIMLLYRLALSVATWIFGFIDSGELSCFSAFRSSLDALISLYAVSAVVYILEIVIFLKGGVSAFV